MPGESRLMSAVMRELKSPFRPRQRSCGMLKISRRLMTKSDRRDLMVIPYHNNEKSLIPERIFKRRWNSGRCQLAE